MNGEALFLGNEPVGDSLNVRRELAMFRNDPLRSYVATLKRDPFVQFLTDDAARYEEAYCFYYLSLDRYFHDMSVSIRWSAGPKWALRERRKYTDYERKIAVEYNAISPFIAYDFWNCLLHARILCDRAIALSRRFLDREPRPSFTSFARHKRFLARHLASPESHGEYVEYLTTRTDWFDVPLKHMRDKYIVAFCIPTHPFHGAPVCGESPCAISSLIISMPRREIGPSRRFAASR